MSKTNQNIKLHIAINRNTHTVYLPIIDKKSLLLNTIHPQKSWLPTHLSVTQRENLQWNSYTPQTPVRQHQIMQGRA